MIPTDFEDDSTVAAMVSELLRDGWVVDRVLPNPWGHVPVTGAGRSLPPRAQEYFERLRSQRRMLDSESRRHHFVPQSYLREWSFDGKRIWTLDTVTGKVSPLGLRSVCVHENFHRVVGPDGEPHNRSCHPRSPICCSTRSSTPSAAERLHGATTTSSDCGTNERVTGTSERWRFASAPCTGTSAAG